MYANCDSRELFEVASEHQFFLCLNSPVFL